MKKESASAASVIICELGAENSSRPIVMILHALFDEAAYDELTEKIDYLYSLGYRTLIIESLAADVTTDQIIKQLQDRVEKAAKTELKSRAKLGKVKTKDIIFSTSVKLKLHVEAGVSKTEIACSEILTKKLADDAFLKLAVRAKQLGMKIIGTRPDDVLEKKLAERATKGTNAAEQAEVLELYEKHISNSMDLAVKHHFTEAEPVILMLSITSIFVVEDYIREINIPKEGFLKELIIGRKFTSGEYMEENIRSFAFATSCQEFHFANNLNALVDQLKERLAALPKKYLDELKKAKKKSVASGDVPSAFETHDRSGDREILYKFTAGMGSKIQLGDSEPCFQMLRGMDLSNV